MHKNFFRLLEEQERSQCKRVIFSKQGDKCNSNSVAIYMKNVFSGDRNDKEKLYHKHAQKE